MDMTALIILAVLGLWAWSSWRSRPAALSDKDGNLVDAKGHFLDLGNVRLPLDGCPCVGNHSGGLDFGSGKHEWASQRVPLVVCSKCGGSTFEPIKVGGDIGMADSIGWRCVNCHWPKSGGLDVPEWERPPKDGAILYKCGKCLSIYDSVNEQIIPGRQCL